MPVLGSTASTSSTPPGWYNVKDYGAVGNNTADDTTAIQAAMNALKANVNAASGSPGGQTLYFPPGFYKVTSTLNFSSLAEVRILGGAGRGSGQVNSIAADANPPTCINYTGANTTSVVNLADSSGCVWDGVSVWSNTASFGGVLLNLDCTATQKVFGTRVQNCQLRAVASTSAAILTSLDGAVEVTYDNVMFLDAGSAAAQVRCMTSGGSAQWCNAIAFRSCSFLGTRSKSVLNPGFQTSFFDCTFEPSTGLVPAPISADLLATGLPDIVTFVGCGFWDATGATGSWITSSVATHAWSFTSCFFESSVAGPILSLNSQNGVAFIGCQFDSPNGGTPNIFDPAHAITNGRMVGCYVKSPVVNNNAAVGVTVL